ncbi:hypothetical protein SAMN05421741_110106 [Paenimyroides ummariense]|uniref:Suppressor of fused protein (SUFU) n=1 Tax=Paenimyroides ummariense TaxID=913024 RepID=A0A1I5BS02_9FLAO|nr:hypothetical protein [Paenimyroides ummariense]SFN77496.1 hypothetical protein SAMN05421741_110106 [Paenimyroides ummariense]
MEEIITSLKHWEAVRNNPDVLTELFMSNLGFELDMSLFPEKKPLHAYAAVKDGELGFYVISEVNDVDSSPEDLSANCYWCPALMAFEGGGQEIPEAEANLRLGTWKETFPIWIQQIVKMPFGIYQTFHIPTTDLKPQKYAALFALKDNIITPDIKEADLVLTNNAGIFYDTIRSQPPYSYTSQYYILSLI